MTAFVIFCIVSICLGIVFAVESPASHPLLVESNSSTLFA